LIKNTQKLNICIFFLQALKIVFPQDFAHIVIRIIHLAIQMSSKEKKKIESNLELSSEEKQDLHPQSIHMEENPPEIPQKKKQSSNSHIPSFFSLLKYANSFD